MEEKYNIYLDDIRTPIQGSDGIPKWTVVRSYDEFVEKINEIGLENIELISLDHDLDRTAMIEWHHNVINNYTINYDNIKEKTGFDCAKWLVEEWKKGKPVVEVVTHSANAIGSANIMGYINNFLHLNYLPQNCIRKHFEYKIQT